MGDNRTRVPGFRSRDVLAALNHFARDVAAQDVRQLDAGQSLAHPQVEVIQRAGADADEHMILAQLGIGNVFVFQNFGTTKFMNADGFHARSFYCNTRKIKTGNS